VPDVHVTVPDSGHLIGDGETLIRLRTAASDVGCTSCEIGDDRGTLSIVLHLPSSSVDEATDAARRLRSWPASAASLCVRWTATRRVGARRAELSERKLLGGRHEQASVRWSRSAYRGLRAPSASCSRPPPSATAAAGPAVAMFPPRLDWQTPRPTEHVALAPGEKMFASGHAAHFDSSARPLLDLGRV